MKTFRSMASLACLIVGSSLAAEDWPRFRGMDGQGVSKDTAALPTTWSHQANLAWKTKLPGPGVSSPIIVGDRVFVTAYSGYGLDRENPGEIEKLVRHLLCFDLKTGESLWQKDVAASLPEDPYTGIGVTAHGYASHTPVSDGTAVYAFFGKSGLHAYSFDGAELWKADLGKESDPWAWGSSSSPILFENLVIVTASAESQSIVGLDKATGKEAWRQSAKGLDGMWGTPTLVKVDDNRTDLVMCVAKEMWGLDPETGKLRWFCDATGADQAHSSVIVDDNMVYATTGRDGGTVAVRMGGSGNVTETHRLWSNDESGSFGSPIKAGSKIYSFSRGVVNVIDSKSGDKVEQLRLQGAQRSGGQFGSLDYPSPVVSGDKLFYVNGSGQTFVLQIGDELKQISVNRVTSDAESFGGTPAISNGRMILRSAAHLYCVMDKGETVDPDDNEVVENDSSESESGGRSGARGEGGQPGGERGGDQRGGRGGFGGQPGGGGGGFDPAQIFERRDSDKDGKLSKSELADSPMANRIEQMDKDGDGSISLEEFRGAMAQFGGGNRGGGRGGSGGSDSRPSRPQRPEIADES